MTRIRYVRGEQRHCDGARHDVMGTLLAPVKNRRIRETYRQSTGAQPFCLSNSLHLENVWLPMKPR